MNLIPEAALALSLLEKRKNRENEQKFVVEGERSVREAKDHILYVIYSRELEVVKWAKDLGMKTYKISHEAFHKISAVESPQGVLAVCKTPEYHLKDILSANNPLIVFCVEIQDPGNLGTIIRTADAAGATGVILSKGTVELYNTKVVRSTMGSVFHLPIVQIKDNEETIKLLKKHKVNLIGSDLKSEKDVWSSNMRGATAILIGNEGAGIPKEILDECDELVLIPMPGKAESLNAGVSSSIFLYEALRQRKMV